MNRGMQGVKTKGQRITPPRPLAVVFLAALSVAGWSADSMVTAEDWETPQTRLRPIGSPSAVDAFHQPAQSPPSQAAQVIQSRQPSPVANSAIRQAVMMQAAPDSFAMPPGLPQGNFTIPPPTSLPAAPSSPWLGPIAPPVDIDTTPLPRPGTSAVTSPPPMPPAQSAPQTFAPPPAGSAASPPGMTPVPRFGSPTAPASSGSDYAPLAQPRLESNFATLGNCRNISAPSGYRSDRILTCGPSAGYVTTVGASAPPPIYAPPPAQLGPPMILPPTAAPFAPTQTVIPGPARHRPLISFGQERYPVQVGQGIFGQPTAYVPGQTFRNAIRYITW